MRKRDRLKLEEVVNETIYEQKNYWYDKTKLVLEIMNEKDIYTNNLRDVINYVIKNIDVCSKHQYLNSVFNSIILLNKFELNELTYKEIAILAITILNEEYECFSHYINIFDKKNLSLIVDVKEYKRECAEYLLYKYMDEYYDDKEIDELSIEDDKFLNDKIYGFLINHSDIEMDYLKENTKHFNYDIIKKQL